MPYQWSESLVREISALDNSGTVGGRHHADLAVVCMRTAVAGTTVPEMRLCSVVIFCGGKKAGNCSCTESCSYLSV